MKRYTPTTTDAMGRCTDGKCPSSGWPHRHDANGRPLQLCRVCGVRPKVEAEKACVDCLTGR